MVATILTDLMLCAGPRGKSLNISYIGEKMLKKVLDFGVQSLKVSDFGAKGVTFKGQSDSGVKSEKVSNFSFEHCF